MEASNKGSLINILNPEIIQTHTVNTVDLNPLVIILLKDNYNVKLIDKTSLKYKCVCPKCNEEEFIIEQANWKCEQCGISGVNSKELLLIVDHENDRKPKLTYSQKKQQEWAMNSKRLSQFMRHINGQPQDDDNQINKDDLIAWWMNRY